ncbi:unnamed protein product [Meganyctiphanes norvegica]|uniref:Uncharacterized protein n=1 Tax=Meganyctiphanes norvegica TaxID=48144 RepID=A0AAV2S6D5_MEGNR
MTNIIILRAPFSSLKHPTQKKNKEPDCWGGCLFDFVFLFIDFIMLSHSTSIHPKKKKNVTLMSWIFFIFIPYAHFSMNNKTLKVCEVILNRFQDIVFLNIF